MNRVILNAREIAHSYRKNGKELEVYRDINLIVRSKQFVAIRGESGCGKTTLLLNCGAMLRPKKGNILIDDENLFAISPADRNRVRSAKIGYVFQTLELVPYLTVLENLTLHDKALKPEAIEWLNRFDLGDRIRHRPDELSHGQRQRVALIRAMVHQPLILIADEPTGNLDEKNTAMVFDILRHFADSGGGVLVASHDPTVESFADQIHYLENRRFKNSPDSSTPTELSPKDL